MTDDIPSDGTGSELALARYDAEFRRTELSIFKKENEKLRADLRHTETKLHRECQRAEKAEAACAEMRSALSPNCPHCGAEILYSDDRGPHCDGCDEYDSDETMRAVLHGTSSNCGRGGIGPETVEKVTEALEQTDDLFAYAVGCAADGGDKSNQARNFLHAKRIMKLCREALAMLPKSEQQKEGA